jgi:hypothetical protein
VYFVGDVRVVIVGFEMFETGDSRAVAAAEAVSRAGVVPCAARAVLARFVVAFTAKAFHELRRAHL